MPRKKIKLSDPDISRYERKAVRNVLLSKSLAQGQLVSEFEKKFSTLVEDRITIAVNSGTSALHTIFMALGVGPGDEVLVPNFSFAASANSVAITGAKPVFVDVDLNTFCMDIEDAKKKISRNTKAILVVHLYGLPADMRKFAELSSSLSLPLVEDAAQSHLAEVDQKRVGTFGIAAAFSFYPSKNMTTGEGGMIVTDSDEIGTFSKMFRNQGMLKKYQNQIIGLNYRMTEINAAIGIEQLRKLPSFTRRRIENAQLMSTKLHGYIDIPRVPSGFKHVYHQYTVKSNKRDKLQEFLFSKNIESGIYYPIPLANLPSFIDQNLTNHLPNTEILARQVLSLPTHPALKRKDVLFVADAVRRFISQPESQRS